LLHHRLISNAPAGAKNGRGRIQLKTAIRAFLAPHFITRQHPFKFQAGTILASAPKEFPNPITDEEKECRSMKKSPETKARVSVIVCLLALMVLPGYAQVVRQAAGATPADIQSAVDAFRADLGGANNGVDGTFPTGRREINWDDVPDQFAAANNLPVNFFNSNSKRGVVFATPGAGFQVSAKAGNPDSIAVEFGNLNPAFPGLFQTFSPERLFTAIGSNVTDVLFFVPGTSTPATVTGFGVVFTDIERSDSARLEFFDVQGRLLYSGFAPAVSGAHESLSFLGASFATAQIAVVRITSGNTALDAQAVNDETNDLVVMDDFIYGEPQAADSNLSCGAKICFAKPSFWAAQLRRRFNSVRGVVYIPSANKGLPIDVQMPTVLIALDPPFFLASQPRNRLIASYVAAQISAQNALTGSLAGGSSTLNCYGLEVPVTLSNGAVIRSFTTVNQLLLETNNAFRQNQSGDIEKLLAIYQKLQSTCNF
jgi:hypothetical protein